MPFDYSPFLIQFTETFGIRYYSLAYLLGVLYGYYWLVKYGKYDKDKVLDFCLYAFLAIVIGGRLGEVFFYHPEWIWESPLQIVKIWEGGMSFHGGLILVVLFVWYWVKKQKWDFLKLADTIVVPALFGIAMAKVGNFFNSELWGVETAVPWCFKVDGWSGCRHPSQLYQALGNTIVGMLLILAYFRPRRKGTIAALFLIGYGVVRVTVEIFWRQPDWVFWGISSGTWLSVPMIIIGFLMFYYLPKTKD